MVSLTATLFQAVMNDAGIADETAEHIIDLAISEICLHGYDVAIPLMSGTAGSKTVSLEPRAYAAVMIVARAIYYGFYKGLQTVTVSGLSVTSADLKSNAIVQAAIEKAARLVSDVDIDYG